MKKQKVFFLFMLVLITSCFYGQDIFDAARKGDVSRMEVLMNMKPDTLSARNAAGFTPLIIAGYRNQLHVVEFLLKNKVDINAPSPEGPVILGACYHGNAELTELLISYKVNVNVCNEAGTTALMFATLANNLPLVKLLLKNGAKKDAKEKSGHTALDYARMKESTEMIGLLSE